MHAISRKASRFLNLHVYESAQKYLQSMLTEKQIDDQQEFERKQISGGLDKLMSNTKKLEDKTYASATVYGSACISSILPDLIAYIDKKKDKFLNQAGNDHALFHKHILPSESSVQAVLATKIVFDMVFSPISKKHRLTPMVEAIGLSLIHI